MIQPLSIVWDFNPVFFSIGSLDIRYYGLMWALAILIGAKFFDNFCKREGLPSKVSESIFIYGTLATILGARLGHCLFYDPMEYLSRPWTIITGFRDGGMASHGAAIGLLIGLWIFSRKNKLPYVWSLDRIMIAVGIGGAVVRHSVHTVRSPCASGAPQTGQRGGKKSAATSRSRSLRIDIADDGYRFEFGIFGERLQLDAQQ